MLAHLNLLHTRIVFPGDLVGVALELAAGVLIVKLYESGFIIRIGEKSRSEGTGAVALVVKFSEPGDGFVVTGFS